MAPFTTLERLRVLEAVEAAGTIAGAARTLGYTASAVSQHVSRLEREAATALVERSNRGVTLTPAGRVLASRAGEILDQVRNAFDEVDGVAERGIASVTIAAFPTAITEILLPARRLLAPSIDLRIVDAESEHAVRAVVARDADAAITDGYAHRLQERTRDLLRTPLRTESIRVVTRADRIEGSLDAYAQRDWVIGGPAGPIGHALRSMCHDAGYAPHVIAETDDHHITFDVIRQTGAVSLLPELALADLPDDIAIDEEIDLPLQRRIEFVTRPSLSDNRAVAECARVVAEAFEAMLDGQPRPGASHRPGGTAGTSTSPRPDEIR